MPAAVEPTNPSRWAERLRALPGQYPSDDRALLALVLGLAIVLLLTFVDHQAGEGDIVIGTVVLGPFVTALLGRPRDVIIVGAVALTAALVSAAWNDNFAEPAYLLRAAAVAFGAAVGAVAARTRGAVARDRARFAVLSALADVTEGRMTLEDTAGRVQDLLVPVIADAAVIDVVRRGTLHRLAVRASGPGAAALEAALRDDGAPGVGVPTPAARPAGGPDAGDDVLQAVEAVRHGVEQLRHLGARSGMVVPLVARGRPLGALSLVTAGSGRELGDSDREFIQVLSGRVALALDNAGLYAELTTIEAQLGAAMSGLAEAVTIQHAEGALVYANDAAARMLGFETARELLAAPVTRIVSRYDTFTEDGSPLEMDALPGRRVLAGERPEPLVVRIVDRESGEERWRVIKATPVGEGTGPARLVVNVLEDITEVKRAELTQRLLAEAGEALASSLDYERTLQQVADLAVPGLADWCAVSLPDGRGYLRSVAVAHRDPGKVAFAREVGDRYPTPMDAPRGAPQVLRDGRPEVVNDIPDDLIRASAIDEEHARLLLEVGMRAALVVPMTSGGEVIGTLALISAESGRTFRPEDVDLAGELARRAGTAVVNSRLYTERSHIARTLQRGLLPSALPDMPGWATATLYRPAGEENLVGGDFYDVLKVSGGWLAFVGDVAGRGPEAAALTALGRHTLRTAARLLPDPLDAVERLDEELLARRPLAMCTVAAVRLTAAAGAAEAEGEILCAGHPPPLLVEGGEVRERGRFGQVLGACPGGVRERERVVLRPGALLVLYTDGVVDTAARDGSRFGEDRLRAVLAEATSAQDAVDRIGAALLDFGAGGQPDDTAVLVLERRVPAPQ